MLPETTPCPSPAAAPGPVPLEPEDELEVTCHIEIEEIGGKTHYRIVLERSEP